jgi:Holliday junction resolvasome RuvABC ATP-dependent DNA helicase subunit
MLGSLTQNDKFFGRQNILQKLDELLLPRHDTIVSAEDGVLKHVTLCGMGGLGKTEIAIEYAFTRRDKFDAIFWIRADALSK